MATGAKIKDAARLANYAAGIVVGKRGTSTVNQEELIRGIRKRS
jgi:bifunctional ADP-heptose synthase (sugar kinase/adenylyltransferase)